MKKFYNLGYGLYLYSKELDSIKKAVIPGASATGGPNDIHVVTFKSGILEILLSFVMDV